MIDDTQGAIVFIIVVLSWYSIGFLLILIKNILFPTRPSPANIYQTMIDIRQQQIRNEIRNELNNENRREKYWQIYYETKT